MYSQWSLSTVILDGYSITPENISSIADGEKVIISPQAMDTVKKTHDILINAAKSGQPIYGLTVGVGLNKDQPIIDIEGNLTDEVIEASKKFNIDLIRAHSGGTGEFLSKKITRAVMVTRLNSLLTGGGGVQTEIINAYLSFLNHDITPVIPTNGSIGQADITVISHIGLAMIGEGDVYYQDERVSAQDALERSGTLVISPFAKDALSIISSNAYSAGTAALALNSIRHLIQVNTLTFALGLEALNGNVSPFLEYSLQLRPYPEVIEVGKDLRSLLAGSSIWMNDEERPLQDPLSFRSGVYLLAELQRSYQQAYSQLLIQLNSSDDNPGVIILDREQITGVVIPTANFDPLPWVVSFQQLGLVLAHNSLASAQQVIKLNNPMFTGLTRFLGTDKTTHAFGAMEKPVVALAMRNKALAMPVSLDYLPVAGEIEDIATNAPLVVERLQKQTDNSYDLLGILLVHQTQAIDLRKQKNNAFKLSPQTEALYNLVRGSVTFMEIDRPLSPDFSAAANILREYTETKTRACCFR